MNDLKCAPCDCNFYHQLRIKLLLGRVALGAQRPIVVKRSVCRSVSPDVRTCIGQLVGLSSALWKNGRLDPDAIWHHRSDRSRDEAGSEVWGSVHGEGYFWGWIWGAPLSKGAYRVYMCYSAVTRPFSQITLGRLVAFGFCEEVSRWHLIVHSSSGYIDYWYDQMLVFVCLYVCGTTCNCCT